LPSKEKGKDSRVLVLGDRRYSPSLQGVLTVTSSTAAAGMYFQREEEAITFNLAPPCLRTRKLSPESRIRVLLYCSHSHSHQALVLEVGRTNSSLRQDTSPHTWNGHKIFRAMFKSSTPSITSGKPDWAISPYSSTY